MEETRTILVVEDDEGIREALRELLIDEGYRVITAVNGEDALEKLGQTRPALLLLDLMLPTMDGLELMELLLADPAWSQLPIVLLTAAPTVGALPAQVAAFLPKPVDVDVLLETIARLC